MRAVRTGPRKCVERLARGSPSEIRDGLAGIHAIENVDCGPYASSGFGHAVDRAFS